MNWKDNCLEYHMRRSIQFFTAFILLLGISMSSEAQLSFTNYKSQTNLSGPLSFYVPTNLRDSNEIHSPKKATIMSAIIPGLGQAYNEKYWKTGFIYLSATALGYLYKLNTDSLRDYEQALTARIDGDANTVDNKYPFFSDAKVKSERDYYRSNRDRVIIGFFALYALQIIDANVDAHLKEFEINEDLALKFDPNWTYDPRWGMQASLRLQLTF